MNRLFREVFMAEGNGGSGGGAGGEGAGSGEGVGSGEGAESNGVNGNGGEFEGGMSTAESFESVGIGVNSEANAEVIGFEESPSYSLSDSSNKGDFDSDSSKDVNNVQKTDIQEVKNLDLIQPGEINDFTPENIDLVPKLYKGIYKIYDQDEEGRLDEVYIGEAERDVRGRLRKHSEGKGNKTVGMLVDYENPLKFLFTPSDNPRGAEAAELDGILGLPPGNKRRETSHLEEFQNEDKSVEELREMIQENNQSEKRGESRRG